MTFSISKSACPFMRLAHSARGVMAIEILQIAEMLCHEVV